MKTIRDTAADSMQQEASAAFEALHTRGGQWLTVNEDGGYEWGWGVAPLDCPPIGVVWNGGTGDIECNCDLCIEDDFVPGDDDVSHSGADLVAAVRNLPVGFFNDEVKN